MEIAFKESHREQAEAGGRKQDHHGHGRDGRQAEDGGHEDDAAGALPGGRKHQQGDQGLAGAEDEDREKNPRRHVHRLRFGVDMSRPDAVRSFGGGMIAVDGAVGVDVKMMMAPIPQAPGQPPEEIAQSEEDEQPGGHAAADALENLQLGHAQPEQDADGADQDGAADVAQAAEGRNGQSLRHGPFPGLGQDDKRKVMIGAGRGVKNAESGGRGDEGGQSGRHRGFPWHESYHLCHKRSIARGFRTERGSARPEFLPADGRPGDPGGDGVDADPRPLGHADRPRPAQLDERIDDVFPIITPAGREIMGQGEIREGGEVKVVGPPDSRFEHPAAPHRDAGRPAMVVDRPGLDDAADPADLDIDDAAGAHLESRPGGRQREDAFIQAERRAHLLLELGMLPEVVRGVRLLDKQQPEFVQGGEGGRVPGPVGAVGIDLEKDAGMAFPDRPAGGRVPARLDLDLDPAISLAEIGADPVDQLRQGILDADADARLDFRPRSPVKLRQRHSGRFRLKIPEGQLQPGLGHPVAPVDRGRPLEFSRAGDIFLENERNEKVFQDVPGRLRRLAAVKGAFLGRALAPAGQPLGLDLDQDERPVIRPAEAGLEKMDIGQAKQEKLETLDFHEGRPKKGARSVPAVSRRT